VYAMRPTLVVVMVYGHNPTASTTVMPAVTALVSDIKKLNGDQHIILVGGHVAAVPAHSLSETGADFVATGEGYETVAQLHYALAAGTSTAAAPGLGFIDQSCTYQATPSPPLVDKIPTVAWDLLPMHKYRCHNWHNDYDPAHR